MEKKAKANEWRERLSADDLRHIKDTTRRGGIDEFKSNREWQKAQIAAGKREPCTQCRIIARKLGLEDLV